MELENYGCEFCLDVDNVLTDDLASSRMPPAVLLLCQKCGQHYSLHACEPHYREPLTLEEVAERFPDHHADADGTAG
jgi:hypothetical protein